MTEISVQNVMKVVKAAKMNILIVFSAKLAISKMKKRTFVWNMTKGRLIPVLMVTFLVKTMINVKVVRVIVIYVKALYYVNIVKKDNF